ncbi:MAG TPA: hypothetical protein VG389_24520, partial [Myxococcota bacterium]|nr:hypothetical protein [Myxococcota bacterium]
MSPCLYSRRGAATAALSALALALALALAAAATGCVAARAATSDAARSSDAGGGGGKDAAVPGDGGGSGTDAGAASCPAGMICPTIFPFHDDNDTSASSTRNFASYGCAPAIDESGPEVVYRLTIAIPGFVSAAVDDAAAGVDVDLQLLDALDPAACLDRGN